MGFGIQQNVRNSSDSSALTLSVTGDSVTSLLFGAQVALTTTATDYDWFYIGSLTDDPAVVPEPETLLLESGLVGVAAFRQRLRRRG